MIDWFRSLFQTAEREAEVTLADLHDDFAAVHAAKTELRSALAAAEETANKFNEAASRKISVLTQSIADIQGEVNLANAHLTTIANEKAKAA